MKRGIFFLYFYKSHHFICQILVGGMENIFHHFTLKTNITNFFFEDVSIFVILVIFCNKRILKFFAYAMFSWKTLVLVFIDLFMSIIWCILWYICITFFFKKLAESFFFSFLILIYVILSTNRGIIYEKLLQIKNNLNLLDYLQYISNYLQHITFQKMFPNFFEVRSKKFFF